MSWGLKRLVILGTGGLAREVLWAASEVPVERRDWEISGFLDDDVEQGRRRLQQHGLGLPVLGTIKDHQPAEEEVFLAAIGDPRGKVRCAQLLEDRGGQFANVIHPSAKVAPSAHLGRGVFVFLYAIVSVCARVGNHVAVNTHGAIGHDAIVEDGCTLSSFTDVTGWVHLERGVFMGSHAVALPRTRVGAFATVGAGSVALGAVRAGCTVFGVPARYLPSAAVS